MHDLTYSYGIWSLLPPLLAIALSITTRRVLWSLISGTFCGAVILGHTQIINSIYIFFNKLIGIFWLPPTDPLTTGGEWNMGNIQIISFLVLLGMLMGLLTQSGAASAFANRLGRYIKTRTQTQLLVTALVLVIFIDDYFHSLTAGNIARPLTDKMQIARAKLAFLLDSTAAPVCVMMPISSWGAYIIALLGSLLIENHINIGGLSAFTQMIPLNFYAILAITMSVCVAAFGLDVGAMARSERQTRLTPPIPPTIVTTAHTSMWHLLIPVLVLIICATGALFYTGYQSVTANGQLPTWLSMLENTNVGYSLVTGGISGVATIVGLLLLSQHSPLALLRASYAGILGMLPAILVLCCAWWLTAMIKDLQTGTYIAGFVSQQASVMWLPALMFLIAGGMAFATGTSWGTFAIMLPLAAQIAAATAPDATLVLLAAVLAGAVFGDHCSPISDTTILSATGAGCDLMEHVNTQLPYVLLCAGMSVLGYLIYGMTQQIGLTWGVLIVVMIIVLVLLKKISLAQMKEIDKPKHASSNI